MELLLAGFWAFVFLGQIHCQDLYVVNNTAEMGRRFEGIGGLSGGGATSKLLVNYPPEQRDQILDYLFKSSKLLVNYHPKQRDQMLDYLFKPLYGASLNILKIEIGGDAQSTDGTEASHMHYSWDENYHRGYEWWLMLEAKKRNPDILLYCLPWAFPAWVGDGTRNPYNNIDKTADYVVKFIKGAWSTYKLRMNYVGIWNEREYNASYIKLLRKKLDAANFTDTFIVAADGSFDGISGNVLSDKKLAEAVYALGAHYPGTKSTAEAVKTGKSLWSSEDYSTFNDNVGAGCWARILNQNYVNGLMTSTISWNLIASYYEELPFGRDGLMTAVSPWSGNYVVEAPIWMTAHTTWFVSPGWFYFGHGTGVYHLKKGGSMVSFQSFDSTQLTMVIETMSHDHSKCIRPALEPYDVSPQKINIQLTGYFAQLSKLYKWSSKLGFDGANSTFLKNEGPVPVINGMVTLSLEVDALYTLTTLQLETKPTYPQIPNKKPFPLPYADSFEIYKQHEEPYDLAQQTGAYEVFSTSTSHGNIIRQMVLDWPCAWCKAESVKSSLNLIGNWSWTDIYTEVETYIGTVNATSGVYVAVRVDKGGCNSFASQGVYFFLFPKQGYLEVSGDLARTKQILRKDVSVQATGWNKLGLLVKGDYAVGTLNGQQVFNTSIASKPANGFVALGTANYGLADFDNLKIISSSDGEKLIRETNNKFYDSSVFYKNKENSISDSKKDSDTLYFEASPKLTDN